MDVLELECGHDIANPVKRAGMKQDNPDKWLKIESDPCSTDQPALVGEGPAFLKRPGDSMVIHELIQSSVGVP